VILYFIMSTAIRSAVNRRVNNPQGGVGVQQQQQQQQQIPQNRVIPNNGQTVGFQPLPQQGNEVNAQFNRGGVPVQQQQQPPQQQRVGSNMTLQQSFDLVFNRLTNLDRSVQQIQQNGAGSGGAGGVDESTINGIVEEFNSRTEILAGEIAELKDMLLKLQTYTLEVNQKLFLQLNQGYSADVNMNENNEETDE
jgi:hypothetical protein